MYSKPILSIVTPTRGNFTDYWLEQLLTIKGDVQFVIVYPPGVVRKESSDGRVKAITSSYKGEMFQRFTGFLNADGQYIIALDDDDYLHPDVAQLVSDYFGAFPESIVLRLKAEKIDYLDYESYQRDWAAIPVMQNLSEDGTSDTRLIPLPIAPLTIPFDKRYLIWPFIKRYDDYSPHIENFNNKVWRSEVVQQALPDLSKTTQLLGVITWIPTSGFDRLMGLYVQACCFEPGKKIGHWMPSPCQIRFISQSPSLKPPRYHFLSDFLLVKRFPQYGYFWNLFFNKLSYLPRLLAKSLQWKLQKKNYRSSPSYGRQSLE